MENCALNKYQIFTDSREGLFAFRLNNLYSQLRAYLDEEQAAGRHLEFSKIFLSDIANQEQELLQSALMTDILGQTAYSVIQQSPVNGSKIGILVKTSAEKSPFLFHCLRLTDEEVMNFGSYIQTVMLFDKYLDYLKQQNLTLKDHCVRTWIYVRDIDTNYNGMVKARNTIFQQHGLSADTHFIASTGIGGRASGSNVSVAIDFLTCPSLKPDDVLYLHALDHLNLTHEYGVAFERGTRITLADGRQQFFISGTASINDKGEVVNVGDVRKQTARLLENIGALLADGGATMNDIRYFIIYVRDIADAPVVEDYMQHHYPDVPRIITYAKVCRQSWLVEMECIAEKAQ